MFIISQDEQRPSVLPGASSGSLPGIGLMDQPGPWSKSTAKWSGTLLELYVMPCEPPEGRQNDLDFTSGGIYRHFGLPP
eukprot:34688-Eustigmatos_ZCMA.PRE.1